MGEHEGVRHRAEQRNRQLAAGQHIRRAAEAREVGRPRRQQAGVVSVRAPQAEVDEQLAGRRQYGPHRLRCDDRLKVDEVEELRLDELRFGDRRRHAQDRLIGKEDGALRKRIDVAAETEGAQPFEQPRVEPAERAESAQIVVREAQFLQEGDSLRQAGRYEKGAGGRELADEQLEYCRVA
jgi:hypothetical protein